MADEIYFLGDSNLNRMAKQVLRKKIEKTERGNNIYQLAVSGQCAMELAQKIKWTTLEESTVVLMIGTNDALKKTNPKRYESALVQIYKQLRGKHIIFCNVMPVPRLQHPNHLIKTYNNIVRSFGPYSNVSLIDVYSEFVSDETGEILIDCFEDDKLHLNNWGLHKLWDLIYDKL